MGRLLKNIFKFILWALLLVIVVAGCYVGYVFLSYDRIPDNQTIEVVNNKDNTAKVPVETELDALSYNIGFCAYTPNFSFFMDGGTESRAKSAESVEKEIVNISRFLEKESPDFLLLEEVDTDSTRSYHINQYEKICALLPDYNHLFAQNYHSAYLMYPILEPHGASNSGIATLSKYPCDSSIRRQLPIETSYMKILDLDRCYSVSRYTCENGKELVVFTTHMSAYTSTGSIATDQLKMMTAQMQEEYDKGNYVIAGGDFNKDLLGDSSQYFHVSGEDYTWAKPIDMSVFDDKNLSLVAPLDEENPVPSCRNCDEPYNPKQFVITVDGFIVSDNVEVVSSEVVDLEFIYSDHNPVKMKFVLK